jgi:hypothetical protein
MSEKPEAKNKETERAVPKDPNPTKRHEQDTQEVEGEDVLNPPPGHELIQRPKVQG